MTARDPDGLLVPMDCETCWGKGKVPTEQPAGPQFAKDDRVKKETNAGDIYGTVIHIESHYDAFAVSNKDALGLMQLLPSTGEWLAPKVGVEWLGAHTLFDPIANVRLGVAYLRQLIDRYDGSIATALAAYNWGPGHIDGRLRRGVPLPTIYARLVLGAYGENS